MSRVAITDARVVDGTGADGLTDQTVIWEAGRISYVGPAEEAILDHALTIPAEGGTVVPGLIDSHVHISVPPILTGIEDVAAESVTRTAIRAAHNAGLLLRAGITTARDVGSRAGVAIDVALAQREGDVQGARIIAAGRGLASLEGHGQTIGVELSGPKEFRNAAIGEIERGAQVIKLFPTGGVLGPGTHGFEIVMSLEEISAAVEAAHEREIAVAAHVHGPDGLDLVLEAGVDTVEHGTGVTAEQAARMAEEGVALVPTLVPLEALLQRELEIPRDLHKRAAQVASVHTAGVATAIEAGVVVLPGTDAGTPFNPPGQLVHEMSLLVELGMSNPEVLRAATSEAARVLGLDDIGILKPGNVADLLLVDADPAEDLGTLSWPATIVQDGVVI